MGDVYATWHRTVPECVRRLVLTDEASALTPPRMLRLVTVR